MYHSFHNCNHFINCKILNKKRITLNIEDYKQWYWSNDEIKNVTVALSLIQNLMNDHNFNYVYEKYYHHPYIQHNLMIKDDIIGLIKFIKKKVRWFPSFAYDVKEITVSNDIVIFHSHVILNLKHRRNYKKGFIVIDKWRFQNGQIIEHWIIINPISFLNKIYMLFEGSLIRNSNLFF